MKLFMNKNIIHTLANARKRIESSHKMTITRKHLFKCADRSWPRVVALDHGAYPKKIRRWKGFLDQTTNGSLGVLG
jgi:hypothetical protein